jgi:hypothetical protein
MDESAATEVHCKMSRACSYPCTDQGFDQICVLLSIINTLAHNICSQMEWITPDYQMDKPFDLTTNCNHECSRDPTSSNCKCCLLRIYIRTIILNEFPSIIEKGANTEAVTSFVDLFFNELLLLTENLDELRETIKKHLYGYKDGNDKLVSDLTNIFKEIKDKANFIIFYKFYIKKGKLYDNQDKESSYLKELLKRGFYATFDDHSLSFLRFLVSEIKNTPELDPSLIKLIKDQPLQSILCGDDQDKINEFMTSYLKKKMKNSDKSMSDVFSELKEQVATIDMSIPNNTIGHAMVLKCIFSYDGTDDRSDNGSDNESDGGIDDGSDDKLDDESGDKLDDESGDKLDDESDNESDDGSDNESDDESDDGIDDWVYYKNSWSSKIGIGGHNFAPLKVFSHCGIFLPKLLKLMDPEYLFNKKTEIREKILHRQKENIKKVTQRQKEEEAARQLRIEEQESLDLFEAEEAAARQEEAARLRAEAEAKKQAKKIYIQKALQQGLPPMKQQQLAPVGKSRVKKKPDSLQDLQNLEIPWNKLKKGGNRSSKKIRRKKSKRNKNQKQKEKKKKTVKRCRQMRKTRRKI